MENKQLICDELLKTLRHTEKCRYISKITYKKDNISEDITITYSNDYYAILDVTGDSGFEMISEIINYLHGWRLTKDYG